VPTLFDKRLLIFTGKGGVGKTTVSAATAIAAARRGKRVVIVEIGDEERVSPLFGRPRVGYAGAIVYGGRDDVAPIRAMCLNARDALHEYAVRSMKFEMLYEAVFENRVMRHFTAAAPGLDELTIMGKIENLHRESLDRSKTKALKFDLMVLDAPATGHALALFKVPKTAMSMAQMSPLHSKAERMWRLLADPFVAALNIVTLPEEMPVNEAIDLHAAATDLGLPRGKLVVNGVYPDLFPSEHDEVRRLREQAPPPQTLPARVAHAALDRAVASVMRRGTQQEMIGTLTTALPHEAVMLPFLFSPTIGLSEIERLADALDRL